MEEQPKLEDGLRELAALIAQMLKAQYCSIILLTEEDIATSEFAPAAHYPDAENKHLMSAPIFSAEQFIGTINVSSPIEKAAFNDSDLEYLRLFALFVGKSIHAAQLQTIVRSKFVQMAVISDFAERQVPAYVALHPNPTKLTKIVAKSFFRELTQAGFTTNQIIEIATEVLNLLQHSLIKYKQRLAREDSERDVGQK